ncbi:MAG: ABC transporter permease [Methylohalobius sp.]|nr:ABC transporter permease [Methylohalobius sp.]
MLWNALILAWRAIRRSLLRSALTVLGVVIGVAAVITMVTVGDGATLQVKQQIASLGSNLLIVRPGQRLAYGQRSTAKALDLSDAQAIGRELPEVAAVAPSAMEAMIAIYGNANWSTTVYGVDNQFLIAKNWPLQAGRPFSVGELRAGKPVCILGASLRKQLFGYQDPLGSKIRLGKLACEVIGLLAVKGQSVMGTDQDDVVLVPLKTFWRRIAGNRDVTLIQVSVRTGVATEKAQRNIERLLRERRRIGPGREDDFYVMDMKELAYTLTGTTRILTSLLGTVAAVSLLVGGIGIMNIMLVSVTERTREIGIRLAIGALEREVLLQFLVEAVVLSACGGLIGILLALAASLGLARLLGVPFVFNAGIVVLAFLVAVAVGVAFGYFPARKAARLDPIEALRYE